MAIRAKTTPRRQLFVPLVMRPFRNPHYNQEPSSATLKTKCIYFKPWAPLPVYKETFRR